MIGVSRVSVAYSSVEIALKLSKMMVLSTNTIGPLATRETFFISYSSENNAAAASSRARVKACMS